MKKEPEFEDIDTIIGKSTKWAMTYGDFMSVLMILFLLLYSMSSMGGKEGLKKLDMIQQAFGGKANKELASSLKQLNLESDIADEIRGFIKVNELTEYAIVKVDDYQIKVILTNSLMFDPGADTLRKESIDLLHRLAMLLKNIPNDVVIEGHTDATPFKKNSKSDFNMELSSKRAQSVLEYFVNVEKLPPNVFSVAGYGPYRPIAKNDTVANKEKNRRVEINIIRKKFINSLTRSET